MMILLCDFFDHVWSCYVQTCYQSKRAFLQQGQVKKKHAPVPKQLKNTIENNLIYNRSIYKVQQTQSGRPTFFSQSQDKFRTKKQHFFTIYFFMLLLVRMITNGTSILS